MSIDAKSMLEAADLRYPRVNGPSDGRVVLDFVPNTSSISASLSEYEELPGIRDVPLSDFHLTGKSYSVSECARIDRLANLIKDSGEIAPLIVVVDSDPDGPYILEGSHRAEALFQLGAKSFPAVILVDLDGLKKDASSFDIVVKNASMPSSGTTVGDASLPLYRFVSGDELRPDGLGTHWTHSRKDVDDMASYEPGFIITATHPGADGIMDWENPDDRKTMENTIGGYEYRDKVFPEVPVRPGTEMNVVKIEKIDADGNRSIVKTPSGLHRRASRLGVMTPEEAKAAGFNIGPVWHGTEAGQFSEYRVPAFFTSSMKYAGKYGNPRMAYLRISNPVMMDQLVDGADAEELAYDPKWLAARKADGNDGIVMVDGDVIDYVVFDPRQVMSVKKPVKASLTGRLLSVFAQESPSSLPERVQFLTVMVDGRPMGRVRTLQEASQKAEEAREQGDFTMDDWPSIELVDESGKIVGNISYNGVVWPGREKDWKPGTVPLYDTKGMRREASDFDVVVKTASSDDEYMKAVEAGDMDAAQKMVDEAATKAGFDTVSFHGSDAGDFNRFKVQRTAEGYFFSPDKATAGFYGPVRKFRLFGGNWADLDDEGTFDKIAREAIFDLNEERDAESVRAWAKQLASYHERHEVREFVAELNGRTLEETGKDFEGDWESAVREMDYSDISEELLGRHPVVKRSIDRHAPLRSPELESAREAYGSQDFYMNYQDDFMKAAQHMGYDGVILTDPAGSTGGESVSHVVFTPNAIKLFDAVTKDDSGNVIPLSKRFDSGTNDIRFNDSAPIIRTAGRTHIGDPFSGSSDKDYFSAVKAGDYAKVRKMLDAAAKKSGYDVGPVYHGSSHKEITEFAGGWWSADRQVPREFGDTVYSAYLKGPFAEAETLREMYKEMHGSDYYEDSDCSLFDSEIGDAAMSGGPFSRLVREQGYAGICVFDESNAISDMAYSVFDPNHVKSASLMTYDRAGDLIPLSKRFDSGSDDMRLDETVPVIRTANDPESRHVASIMQTAGVPERVGILPIPSGNIRLYHYTNADPEVIRKEGLKLSMARGSTYGEPNMVWASSVPMTESKNVVEFSVPADDPSMALERPNKGQDPAEWMKGNHHVGFGRDIRPEEILAVHEPWHKFYRYIKDNPRTMKDIADGKLDDLDKTYHPNEFRAVQEVKKEMGTVNHEVVTAAKKATRQPRPKFIPNAKFIHMSADADSLVSSGWDSSREGSVGGSLYKGISVTLPDYVDSWKHIAKLGGTTPVWVTLPADKKLLDFYGTFGSKDVSDNQFVSEWARKQGRWQETTRKQVAHYDEDGEIMGWMDDDPGEDFEIDVNEPHDDDNPEVREYTGFSWDEHEAIYKAYVEQMIPEACGVWYWDQDDSVGLSAPQGIIDVRFAGALRFSPVTNQRTASADGIKAYHGSGTNIQEFSYEFAGMGADQLGSGFYFTTDEEEAFGYTTNRHQSDAEKPGGEDSPTVLEVRLDIKNPLDADAVGTITKAKVRKLIMMSPVLEESLIDWGDVEFEGREKVLSQAVEAYAHQATSNRIVRALFSIANDFYRGHIKEFNDAVTKVLGYDGIVKHFDNPDGCFAMRDHYVAFRPDQIRIVDRKPAIKTASEQMEFNLDIQTNSKPIRLEDVNALRNEIADAANKILDAWQQDADGIDEEFGGGGVCDAIAHEIQGVLSQHGYDVSEGGQDGDDHAWVVVYDEKTALAIDIPPGVYETGAGYSWKKIEGAHVNPDDIQIGTTWREAVPMERNAGVADSGDEHPVAAVIVAAGRIFEGRTHFEALQKAKMLGYVEDGDDGNIVDRNGKVMNYDGSIDLFMTNKGRLIDRFEAMAMGKATGAEYIPEKDRDDVDTIVKRHSGVEARVSERDNGTIVLDHLRVPRESRSEGLGSAFMQDLCAYADRRGKDIELSLGDKKPGETTSKGRLIKFYGRFGFVRNFGRTVDFRRSCQMYRRPQGKKTAGTEFEIKVANESIESWLASSVVKTPVFHGSSSEPFDSFDAKRTGFNFGEASQGAFFFTNSESGAEFYRRNALDMHEMDEGGFVGKFYIKIERPFVPEEDFIIRKGMEGVVAAAKSKGCDGVVYKDTGETVYAVFDASQIRKSEQAKEVFASNGGWFGNSKVVDANGNPLVVYHGSRNPMTEDFSHDLEGTGVASGGNGQTKYGGFFFTSEPDNAQFFADPKDLTELNPDLVSAYGSGDEWYYDAADDEGNSWLNGGKFNTPELAENAGKKHVKRYNEALRRKEDMFVRGYNLRIENPLEIDSGEMGSNKWSPPMLIPLAKDAGKDGIIIRGYQDGAMQSDIYIVFDGSQVRPSKTGQLKAADDHSFEIVITGRLNTDTGVDDAPAEGHLDTQLFEGCKGTKFDRDVVGKYRRRLKKHKVKKAQVDGDRDINGEMIAELEAEYWRKWTPVTSSMIREVAYDDKTGELVFKMKNHAEYSFRNVPRCEYDAFMAAESKGKWFADFRKRYREAKGKLAEFDGAITKNASLFHGLPTNMTNGDVDNFFVNFLGFTAGKKKGSHVDYRRSDIPVPAEVSLHGDLDNPYINYDGGFGHALRDVGLREPVFVEYYQNPKYWIKRARQVGIKNAVTELLHKSGMFDKAYISDFWKNKPKEEKTIDFAFDTYKVNVMMSKMPFLGELFKAFTKDMSTEEAYDLIFTQIKSSPKMMATYNAIGAPVPGDSGKVASSNAMVKIAASWGTAGSGVMYFCPDDNSVLLLERSMDVMDGGTWGIPGGAVKGTEGIYGDDELDGKDFDEETLKSSAHQEVEEEMGHVPEGKDMGSVTIPFGKFKYTTFFKSVRKDQKDAILNAIELNWESTDSRWFPLANLPKNVHPGVAKAVELKFGTNEA